MPTTTPKRAITLNYIYMYIYITYMCYTQVRMDRLPKRPR